MTPLMINIALWYHCRGTDYGTDGSDYNFDAPAVQEALRAFQARGLLVDDETGRKSFRGTEALEVYIEALLAVPFPVKKWVMP